MTILERYTDTREKENDYMMSIKRFMSRVYTSRKVINVGDHTLYVEHSLKQNEVSNNIASHFVLNMWVQKIYKHVIIIMLKRVTKWNRTVESNCIYYIDTLPTKGTCTIHCFIIMNELSIYYLLRCAWPSFYGLNYRIHVLRML